MDIYVKNSDELIGAIDKAHSVNEPVNVYLSAGDYEITKEINLSRSNLSIIGENGTNLFGSRKIALTDCPMEGRLRVVDLDTAGVDDMGEFGQGPFKDFWNVYDIPKPHQIDQGPGLELFYNEKRMPLSRYPKKDYLYITETLGKTPIYGWNKNGHEQIGHAEGIFKANDTTINDWPDYNEWLVVGFWHWDWATQRHTLKSFKNGVFEVSGEYHFEGYRSGPVKDGTDGANFYILNAKNAITEPGDWCIDRANKKLYIYPYEGQEYVKVSCAENIFYGKGLSDITIKNISFAECRRCGVCIEDSININISNCNVINSGGWGIICENCTEVSVYGCEVSLMGGGGIGVSGGNREELISSNNIIKKCTVHNIGLWHRTYMAAFDISGVGCTLTENYLYDVPSLGIVYAGNNHIIEKNEIKNACSESNDAGAIYTGRNYTFRGNIIRYNYLHDLVGFKNRGCVGLYLDDCVSSIEAYGNIFENIPYIAFELGGGRDNIIHDNTFINCGITMTLDKRGSVWDSYKNGGGRLGERLAEIDYRSPVWKEAYPKLYNIKEENMLMPMNNEFYNNNIFGGHGVAVYSEDILPITKMHDNTFSHIDKVDPQARDVIGWVYITE